MSSLVVRDTNQTGATPEEKDRNERFHGMRYAGLRFNKYFMEMNGNNPAYDADEIIGLTLTDCAKTDTDSTLHTYKTYYFDQNGEECEVEITRNMGNKYKYEYQEIVGGNPTGNMKVLRINGRDDKPNPNKKMNIVIPQNRGDLLGANSYLDNIVEDLKGVSDANDNQYVLGTITFRRCA